MKDGRVGRCEPEEAETSKRPSAEETRAVAGHCTEPGCDCWLPENYFFLGRASVDTNTELEEFVAVRSLLGIDEVDFRSAAASLMVAILEDGQESAMNSGSLMAFGESLMAKTMTYEESVTLFRILPPYLEYLTEQHAKLAENDESEDGSDVCSVPVTLLPRICGAFSHSTFMKRRRIVVMSNVFAGVPADVQASMERFDIKGSADNRTQRRVGAEFLDFDLFRSDRKLLPLDPIEGEKLLAVLERDTAFLLKQSVQDRFADRWPDLFRNEPGLMDYSLLVGLVPCDMPGGLARLDINDSRTVCEYIPSEALSAHASSMPMKKRWTLESEKKTALFGIVDILQFWTTKKLIANTFKRCIGLEQDDGRDCTNDILDTVRPRCYRYRLLRLAGELLRPGSWLESLPRMYGGDWSRVLMRQIIHLPAEQMAKARLRYFDATREVELRRRQRAGSIRGFLASGAEDEGSVGSSCCSGAGHSATASTSAQSLEDFLALDELDDDDFSGSIIDDFSVGRPLERACIPSSLMAAASEPASLLEAPQSHPAKPQEFQKEVPQLHDLESPPRAQHQNHVPVCEVVNSCESFCICEEVRNSQDELILGATKSSGAVLAPIATPPDVLGEGHSNNSCLFYKMYSSAESFECEVEMR